MNETYMDPLPGTCDTPRQLHADMSQVEALAAVNSVRDSVDKMERAHALRYAINCAEGINLLATHVNRLAAHFYRDINTGLPIERNKGELIALMHSELSEMLEGVRKGTMDSHLPARRSEEVELADLVIRALDYAAWRRMDLQGAIVDKLQYNAVRKDHTDEARRATNGKKF